MTLDLTRYAPTLSLLIGGIPQPDLRKAIISLDVDESLESASMFTFSINEGLDKKTQKFKWLDSKLLDPESGDDVEIHLGYAGSVSKSSEPLIVGKITALNPSFPSSGTPSLSVQGYDHSFCLQKSVVKDKRTFKDKSYQDVVMKIAGEQNLGKGDIDSAIKPCEKIVQNAGESDYAFLKRLADRIGYEFFVRNKKIYFRKPMDYTKEALSLEWGKEILSFNPRMSTAKVVNKVTVRGHNEKDPAKPIVGTATLSDLGFKEPGARSAAEGLKSCQNKETEASESDFPVCSEEDAKNLAKALLIKANNSLIEGTCECIGIPEIRAGMNIRINGVGKRFSGRYYVKSVKHTLGDGGYTMSFDVRRGGSGIV
jgi:phage protein D